MSKSKQNKQAQIDHVPNLEVPLDVLVEQEIKQSDWIPSETPKYVVIRGGLRVSDREYLNIDDLTAIEEKKTLGKYN